MTKKCIINLDGVELIDLTPEEEQEFQNLQTAHNEDVAENGTFEERKNARIQAQEDLKASAKAKLMAGEALTEDEANVMIGG
jgi:hypothetical protein